MKSRMIEGLSINEQEQMKYEYEKAYHFRQRLQQILEKEIETFVINMTKEEHFDSPSWPLVQADRVAQIKAYRKIIGLLE